MQNLQFSSTHFCTPYGFHRLCLDQSKVINVWYLFTVFVKCTIHNYSRRYQAVLYFLLSYLFIFLLNIYSSPLSPGEIIPGFFNSYKVWKWRFEMAKIDKKNKQLESLCTVLLSCFSKGDLNETLTTLWLHWKYQFSEESVKGSTKYVSPCLHWESH